MSTPSIVLALLEKFVSAFRLTTCRVLDFQPADSVISVCTQPALSNDAFQVVVTNLFEERNAVLLDMLGVKDSLAIAALQRFLKSSRPFDERKTTQIFAIKPQKIKGIEDWLARE